MTRRLALIVIAANLVGLIALIFVYPHLMVSPGPLIPAACGPHHGLFRLPRPSARRGADAMHGLPRARGHRSPDEFRRPSVSAVREGLLPPGPEVAGLHGLP